MGLGSAVASIFGSGDPQGAFANLVKERETKTKAANTTRQSRQQRKKRGRRQAQAPTANRRASLLTGPTVTGGGSPGGPLLGG